MRSLADDLRGRSDDELAALLRARPDLARPAPTDVTALAARATTRTSIQRALDGLDVAHLHALEAVVVAAPAQPADVAGLLGTDEDRATVLTSRLRELALCWQAPEGMRPARPVVDVVGEPAGLGPPGEETPQGAALTAALAALDERQRSLVEALTWGPAVGALSAGSSPMAAAAEALVGTGLLLRVDDGHVLLPRQVALALRDGRLHRHPATEPPEVERTLLDPDVVDLASGGRAADLLVLATEVVDSWGARPPRQLRGGGLAVRDLARLAGHLEIADDEAAWLVETLHAAGLVAVDDGGRLRETAEPAWVPTTAADDWLEEDTGRRWARLARAWWSMSAAPSLVGSGETGRVNALSTHTSYPWGRQRRQDTLAALDTLAPGTAPTEEGLAALLRWRHPLRTARSGDVGVALQVVLREAEWAGVTGRGALSGPGRALLREGPGGVEAAASLMTPLVPPPVDHVLLQADLTAIAPGRLDGPVRTLMRLVSDVESRGGATVHRFSETSVRRALDLGWSADRVLVELAEASRTGVPQPLDYLVRDVARRHGQVRVGATASYLRCDDPALLDRIEHDRALGMMQWRRIAPTVLVSAVPAPTVLDVLREEQYGPVVEGGDGGVQVGAPQWRRTTLRPASPVVVTGVDAAVARQVVALMRRGEGARSAGLDETSSTDPIVITAALREAAAAGEALWIGYADDSGGVATHLVRPLRVEGGRVRAVVGDGDAARTFLVHRVTRVRAAE
ncbi:MULTISPECIES: helicase-associated domain-containing protein [unclassified Ornithinimicrobium]|uniref:helicase-associated domain-containing protein n=1 Tax=unclassified Ornithinimicrobium TaxID=2615080 RepID=UPI003851AA7F